MYNGYNTVTGWSGRCARYVGSGRGKHGGVGGGLLYLKRTPTEQLQKAEAVAEQYRGSRLLFEGKCFYFILFYFFKLLYLFFLGKMGAVNFNLGI